MTYLTHEIVLSFFLRVILGILFFFQGYDKVFRLKISGVISFFREESRQRPMPEFMLVSSAYATSYIEMVAGGMLILGLFKTWAMYLLGLDLILVCGAFSILKPMWDMYLLFPRLLMLAILLYLPAEWDVLSLDFLFN
jgi:putative oxidoreductase